MLTLPPSPSGRVSGWSGPPRARGRSSFHQRPGGPTESCGQVSRGSRVEQEPRALGARRKRAPAAAGSPASPSAAATAPAFDSPSAVTTSEARRGDRRQRERQSSGGRLRRVGHGGDETAALVEQWMIRGRARRRARPRRPRARASRGAADRRGSRPVPARRRRPPPRDRAARPGSRWTIRRRDRGRIEPEALREAEVRLRIGDRHRPFVAPEEVGSGASRRRPERGQGRTGPPPSLRAGPARIVRGRRSPPQPPARAGRGQRRELPRRADEDLRLHADDPSLPRLLEPASRPEGSRRQPPTGIRFALEEEATMQFGMIGLGRMGANMVRRLMQGGHELCRLRPRAGRGRALAPKGRPAAPRSPSSSPARDAARSLADGPGGLGRLDHRRPRAPPRRRRHRRSTAATPTTRTTSRAPRGCARAGIHYVDMGTSGGVWGLERGYCLMIGGETEVVRHLDPIFTTLAPGRRRHPAHAGREPRAAPPSRATCTAARRRRSLREDDPQRHRVRPDGGLRRGLQHPAATPNIGKRDPREGR